MFLVQGKLTITTTMSESCFALNTVLAVASNYHLFFFSQLCCMLYIFFFLLKHREENVTKSDVTIIIRIVLAYASLLFFCACAWIS